MKLITLTTFIIFIANVVHSIPTPQLNDEDDVYVLPKTITPTLYQLEIIVPDEFQTVQQYQGKNTITFNVAKDTSIQEIKLHSKGLTITKAQLLEAGSTSPKDLKITDPDTITDILVFALDAELKEDGHQLILEFTGPLSNKTLSGFYLSSYIEDTDLEKFVASTQFEPVHAREAFPCFDEPQLKAQFEIKITAPQGYSSLSNTPGKPQEGNPLTTVFGRTPRMSTYLIAFVVSEYNSTSGSPIGDQEVKVWSRGESVNMRNYAADTASKLLQIMESYTGVSYDHLEVGKLDNVAIPKFNPGAMENWGLVTYRESLLLTDDSSIVDQQAVATIMGHELSHQWFGDLVTMNWWTDVFLNEGFARYFEYHATDEISPEWELPKKFAVTRMYEALAADSNGASLPLSSYVSKPADISKRFDTISYDKGASVLRMVSHFLTLEEFKNGLKDYIELNKVAGTATPKELWASLGKFTSKANIDVPLETIMNEWTYKAGYPWIKVVESGNDVVISQKPVFGEETTLWYVPISYGTAKTNSDLKDTSAKTWLTPDTPEVTLTNALSGSDDWFIVNVQASAFYREYYDQSLLARISNVLKSNPGNIDVLSRAQLVDNLFALAKSDMEGYDYEAVFKVLAYLMNDTDYYPWYAAFKGFEQLLTRVNTASVRTSFALYITRLMKNLYGTITFDKEDPSNLIFTMKQILGLSWACKLGTEDCIDTSKKLFKDFKDNPSETPISSNLKTVVYCNALRNSDNVTDDWNFLLELYKTSTTTPIEKNAILEALGCAKDGDILKSYMKMAINEKLDLIKKPDINSVFSSVCNNNPEGVEIAFSFILSNHNEIVQLFDDNGKEFLSLLTLIANKITDEKEAVALQAFLNLSAAETTDEEKEQIKITIDKIYENLEVTTSLEKQLVSYFKEQEDDGDSATRQTVQFGTYAIMFLIIFFTKSYIFSV